MKEAIRQAKKAWKIEEVPIGCVIVYQGKIIGRGYNRRTTDKNPLAHAEISAIKKASKVMGDWRLEECTLYVTLEPCQMCSGAIVQARIPRVVVGCMNPKAGCAGSILNLLQVEAFNHQAELTTGVLEEECSQMMKSFFKELRKKQKMKKKEHIPKNTNMKPFEFCLPVIIFPSFKIGGKIIPYFPNSLWLILYKTFHFRNNIQYYH